MREGDVIIKVNGQQVFCCYLVSNSTSAEESPVFTLSSQVTESSHSEVVKQIQLGSYVALTVVHASRF